MGARDAQAPQTYCSHLTGKFCSPRNAQPPIRTGSRSSVSKVTSRIDHGFAMRRGDMPIGEIQRAYS